jgi:hypothetical protein
MMNGWQKLLTGAACAGLILAMDVLKVNDPQLKYAMMSVLGLLVTGHVAVNLPTVNVGK